MRLRWCRCSIVRSLVPSGQDAAPEVGGEKRTPANGAFFVVSRHKRLIEQKITQGKNSFSPLPDLASICDML
jgi:hypothetical protein